MPYVHTCGAFSFLSACSLCGLHLMSYWRIKFPCRSTPETKTFVEGMADMIFVNSKFTGTTFVKGHSSNWMPEKFGRLFFTPQRMFEYLEELNNLTEREGVSTKVEFITSCSTARRNHLLSEFYTPNVNQLFMDEHFVIVPLEAMAAQKPVIACNSVGPVKTIKNGMTGFLCDPTPEEFGSAMANKLIEDPPMAETMGKDARKHLEMISIKIFGQRQNQYILDPVRRKMD